MASISHAGGELRTNAILITKDGKKINLGHIDRKLLGLVPWTPRLWYYKFVIYPRRQHKQERK